MSDQDKMVRPGDDAVEQRGLVADIATPAAIIAAPYVQAWAQQHFSKPQDPPPPSNNRPSGEQG